MTDANRPSKYGMQGEPSELVGSEGCRAAEAQRQSAAWEVERRQITEALGRAPGTPIPTKPATTLTRYLLSLARQSVRLAATLQIRNLLQFLLAAWRRESGVRRLRASGLFDQDFYRSQFAVPIGDAIRHYLERGSNDGAWPHPLFDTGFYHAKHPDVRVAGLAPLLHYLQTWSEEGRRPNAFFDPRWYARNNPDMVRLKLDPVSHYLALGRSRNADPSAEFDMVFYRRELERTGQADVDPLAHFLHTGRKSGLLPALRETPLGDPVERATIEQTKVGRLGPEVALFVTHSPDGQLKPHVRPYLEALASEGIDIVLIVAADRPFTAGDAWLSDLVTILAIRENVGFDFAAWAHVMRLHHELYQAHLVLLLNDSLIGPVGSDAFSAMMRRIRDSKADIVGLTDNYEHGHHVQSFFLTLKRGALASREFHRFIQNIVSLPTKNDVIERYEVSFVPQMLNGGLTVEVLFPATDHLNPSIFHWRDLLERGFPFIKVMLVRDDISGADKSGWREVLSSRGYDIALIDRLLAPSRPAGGEDGVTR